MTDTSTHPFARLASDRPESRWMLFPTPHLRALFQRRTRGQWGYVNTWTDAEGFGLHCITWDELRASGGVPNQGAVTSTRWGTPVVCQNRLAFDDMIDQRGEPVSTGMCADCGTTHFPIHPEAIDQRGEPICTRCAAAGAFD